MVSGSVLVLVVLMCMCMCYVSEGSRVFIFANKCPETVWVGSTGGFTQNCQAGRCPAGQACLNVRNPPGCFWVLPEGNGREIQSGHSFSVTLNAPAQNNIKWSGNVWGKTRCNGNGRGCATGDCGSCDPGQGASGPATLAEFTLLDSGVDTYDVSLINGINVPIEMKPLTSQNLGQFNSKLQSVAGAKLNYSLPTANDYWCGNPGGKTPKNGALVGCSWNFNTNINGRDLSPYLNIVTNGGRACNSQNCGAGEVCGLSIATRQMTCGTKLGYWTADEVCGYGNFGDPFNCNSGVPGQGNHGNLYGCSGPNSNSCYQPGASGTCCGCPNWVVNGKTLPAGITCHNSNGQWNNIAYPFAKFVKDACPTGYSFPYDDATSTFQCNSGGNPNAIGYQITYCPNYADDNTEILSKQ